MSSEYVLVLNERIEIDPTELHKKGFVGEIMWDIAFCDSEACRDTETYLGLLEYTAKEIISKVNGRKI